MDETFFFDPLGTYFPPLVERRARVAFSRLRRQRRLRGTERCHDPRIDRQWLRGRVPAEQICCGALAAHAGIVTWLANWRGKISMHFSASDFDAIITNAAGCGSTLKEYDHLFTADEPEYAQAQAFRCKIRDVTEFLPRSAFRELKPIRQRVTYQDSCHLLHGQKIREAPRNCCSAIPESNWWNCHFPKSVAAPQGFTTSRKPRHLSSCLQKRCARPATGAIIATSNPGPGAKLQQAARVGGSDDRGAGSGGVLHFLG